MQTFPPKEDKCDMVIQTVKLKFILTTKLTFAK